MRAVVLLLLVHAAAAAGSEVHLRSKAAKQTALLERLAVKYACATTDFPEMLKKIEAEVDASVESVGEKKSRVTFTFETTGDATALSRDLPTVDAAVCTTFDGMVEQSAMGNPVTKNKGCNRLSVKSPSASLIELSAGMGEMMTVAHSVEVELPENLADSLIGSITRSAACGEFSKALSTTLGTPITVGCGNHHAGTASGCDRPTDSMAQSIARAKSSATCPARMAQTKSSTPACEGAAQTKAHQLKQKYFATHTSAHDDKLGTIETDYTICTDKATADFVVAIALEKQAHDAALAQHSLIKQQQLKAESDLGTKNAAHLSNTNDLVARQEEQTIALANAKKAAKAADAILNTDYQRMMTQATKTYTDQVVIIDAETATAVKICDSSYHKTNNIIKADEATLAEMQILLPTLELCESKKITKPVEDPFETAAAIAARMASVAEKAGEESRAVEAVKISAAKKEAVEEAAAEAEKKSAAAKEAEEVAVKKTRRRRLLSPTDCADVHKEATRLSAALDMADQDGQVVSFLQAGEAGAPARSSLMRFKAILAEDVKVTAPVVSTLQSSTDKLVTARSVAKDHSITCVSSAQGKSTTAKILADGVKVGDEGKAAGFKAETGADILKQYEKVRSEHDKIVEGAEADVQGSLAAVEAAKTKASDAETNTEKAQGAVKGTSAALAQASDDAGKYLKAAKTLCAAHKDARVAKEGETLKNAIKQTEVTVQAVLDDDNAACSQARALAQKARMDLMDTQRTVRSLSMNLAGTSTVAVTTAPAVTTTTAVKVSVS